MLSLTRVVLLVTIQTPAKVTSRYVLCSSVHLQGQRSFEYCMTLLASGACSRFLFCKTESCVKLVLIHVLFTRFGRLFRINRGRRLQSSTFVFFI